MARSIEAILWLGVALLSVESRHKFRHKRNGTANYPYENLISSSVAYCYDKLYNDSDCCTDVQYAPGVKRHILTRPEAVWYCDKTCWDDKRGQRGEDALWIPDGATCTSPRILWLHGGSWEYGSPVTEGFGQLASKIAALSGAVVMMIDYPLAPVGDYHSILDAALKGLQWLSQAPLQELACPPSASAPLFLGGDSAGGGTAVSLTLELKKAGGWSPLGVGPSNPEYLPGGKLLAGTILFSPWTNLRCDTPDYYFDAFAEVVDQKAFKNPRAGTAYVGDLMFRGHPEENLDDFTANAEDYVGYNTALLTDPVASPFFAGVAELGGGGIPPLHISVGDSESIKGDSLIFAQKAAFYGAEVHLDVYMGMWHDFEMYSEGCGGSQPLWQAQRALNRTAEFVKRVSYEKLTSSQLGLLWPPSQSRTGTPQTSYVYDLSREDATTWFPAAVREATLSLGAEAVAARGPRRARKRRAAPSLRWPRSAAGAVALWLSGAVFGACCLSIVLRSKTPLLLQGRGDEARTPFLQV
eukprot:TRINITY_DN63199_c0_g1_i1.p1 TRINITY_DN63199_c0_g1~~TRINITY_DN63199_c0_g1_i1.p1  ORF type:complete len:525 (-),score=109.14 TRINITY_DN63199_c0_g1_i1:201-1775(-)